MPAPPTVGLEVDALELVTALLRGDPGASCVLDRSTGRVHRIVGECDPDEEGIALDDASRYLAIAAWPRARVERFWGRAAPTRSPPRASGLYRPLAALRPEERAHVLEVVRAEAEQWLAAQGILAELRVA